LGRARDTGLPALSGRVTLKQEIDDERQAGFLLYVPVFRGGLIPQTVEARREALLGFVYIPFRAGDLLEGTFGEGRPSRVAFTLDDGEGVDPSRRLYASHDSREVERARHRQTVQLEVAGRPWTLHVASLPAFEASSARPLVWPLGALGLVVSAVLYLLASGQAQARAASEERAAALALSLSAQARVEAELREADRRKDEFLAMLAHELRNPLAPILSAAQLMERKLAAGLGVERERQVVHRQVLHLSRLVDDLLDVSRVTRGKVQLQRGPLSLETAVERALEAVRPLAEARQHRVVLEPAEERLWVEADPVRLEQVLSNLLTNAAKYTEPGGRISVGVAREAGEALVRVADTGMGIAPEALPSLFEPFVQLQHTLDRAQGGLGLGLTLVRALVEMHGGRVQVHSDGPGRGSTFTVRLPLLRAEPLGPPSAEPALDVALPVQAGGPLRVLVVDDNVDAAEALAEGLALDGHQVALAHDGAQALAEAERQRPDAIFLDIGLPVLDGLEVARRLRARQELQGCLLVALTGYGQASDRAATREAGFDAHLVKPAGLDALRATLSGRSARPAPDAAPL
jgi:signal transduction histidine kinase/ActR/RegA family two-component response regulator